MRALCGAIITAGAVIGLGLTAIGLGTRYTREHNWPVVKAVADKDEADKADATKTTTEDKVYVARFSQMDTPMLFVLIFLTSVALVGLGIAILGLAYHHHRREREYAHLREEIASRQRTTV